MRNYINKLSLRKKTERSLNHFLMIDWKKAVGLASVEKYHEADERYCLMYC